MIETGNVVIADLKCFFKHVDGLVELLGVLVSQPLAMVELGIAWHEFDSTVEILMRQVYLPQSKVGVPPVEESSCVIGVKVQCLVVLGQALVIELVMVKGQCFVVIIGRLGRILLDCLLKSLQGHVVLLVLKVGESEVVLGRSIIPVHVTRLSEVLDALAVLLDLPVAVASMEEGFELGVPSYLDLVEPLAEVLDGLREVHEPGKPS